MITSSNHCKFILPDRAIPQISLQQKGNSSIVDNYFIQSFVQRFISIGVVDICIDSCSTIFDELYQLELCSHNFVSIDSDVQSANSVSDILGAALRQNHIIIHSTGSKISYISTTGENEPPPELVQTILRVYSPLRKFILAIEHQSLVDIDWILLKRDLKRIYEYTVSNNERSLILLSLLQVLSTYEEQTLSCLEVVMNSHNYVELLQEISKNQDYLELSKYVSDLGSSGFSTQIHLQIENLIHHLCSSYGQKYFFEPNQLKVLISRGIPSLPIRDKELIFRQNNYLPPILCLKKDAEKARAAWNKAHPDNYLSREILQEHWEVRYWI